MSFWQSTKQSYIALIEFLQSIFQLVCVYFELVLSLFYTLYQDLGCGWGSLSLYICEKFPRCQVTCVSNSNTQRQLIQQRSEERGYMGRLECITADANVFTTANRFDRICSIEMFEVCSHVKAENWCNCILKTKTIFPTIHHCAVCLFLFYFIGCTGHSTFTTCSLKMYLVICLLWKFQYFYLTNNSFLTSHGYRMSVFLHTLLLSTSKSLWKKYQLAENINRNWLKTTHRIQCLKGRTF